MAAFDFPDAPAFGDKYPVNATAGQPQYIWDGEKWSTGNVGNIPLYEITNQIVNDFNTHIWKSGSFYAPIGAANAPVAGHNFIGIAYMQDADSGFMEARDFYSSASEKYCRWQEGGSWGPWELDSGARTFVKLAGDTMTGGLTITSAAGNASFGLNKVAAGGSNDIYGTKAGGGRWLLRLGDPAAESGSNSGSNFTLARYNDANAIIDAPFTINRATAAASFTGQISAPSIELGSTTVGGVSYIDLHSSGMPSDYDVRIMSTGGDATNGKGALNFSAYTSSFGFNGLAGAEKITCTLFGGNPAAGGGGAFYFNSGAGNHWILGQRSAIYGAGSAEFILHNSAVGGPAFTIQSDSRATFSSNLTALIFIPGSGFQCRQGAPGPAGGNQFNFYWTGSAMQMWVDAVNLGAITSDYRTKKDVIDLPGMWDTVKGLRPIKYTQAEFTPPSQEEANQKKLEKDADYVAPGPIYVADDIERWGFVAHELQETLLPSAATGVKDSPDTVQSPNLAPLVAALTKALQEAMARIEALEATR